MVRREPDKLRHPGSFRKWTWCPSREGESLDNVGFVYFDDPYGDGWTVQQISSRD